ncbi:MAG: aminoglycoside 3'-phosphotransferase [Clostridia bacterium]|nr:aminoglycoside 3'-phosphotransferase [Clostridia bacterium]
MEKRKIHIDLNEYPQSFHKFLKDATVYDSSCSKEARVIFIDKDGGYYLKKAEKGSLKTEAELTAYFNQKGLATEVLAYESDAFDYFLTRKVQGEDCVYRGYLENPKKLCETTATLLRKLHEEDFSDCPIDRLNTYFETVDNNYRKEIFDNSIFTPKWQLGNREETKKYADSNRHLLKSDVLLHGDYCLPNIILDNWKFSAFIDLGNGGVGDRHIDLFWGIWTLYFNLKTNKYDDYFMDAYGRDKIEEEKLYLVAAMEAFG